MTYLELKIAVLQKMFAITGSSVVEDDTTQPYIASIPQAANEGIDLLAQTGRYVRASAVIRQAEILPAEEEQEEGETWRQLCAGWQRYDMEELIGSSYRKIDENNVWFEDPETLEYTTTRRYRIEAGRYLLLEGSIEGAWRVYALCIPAPLTLSEDTPDSYELPLPKECCDILPLYIASQLYKDDDISMATIWRNEFETAKEAILAMAQGESTSGGSFESETGWW